MVQVNGVPTFGVQGGFLSSGSPSSAGSSSSSSSSSTATPGQSAANTLSTGVMTMIVMGLATLLGGMMAVF